MGSEAAFRHVGVRARRMRKSFALVVTAAVLAGLPAPVAFAVPTAASADSSSGASTDAGSENATSEARAAAEEAADTGERVEILGKRTEYATTFANPDGVTFSLSQSAVPVRVEQPDGSWAEPDATLERRADGSIGPKAAVAEVSFSAGGDGAGLVTVAEGKRSLMVGWPGELPEPVLDGASAVYADVLPGVDLRMTATTEGYRQVLVVKTAEAAASDELEKLDFPVEAQGLTLRGGVGGGLNALDENGNAVFRTPAARQWDSAGDAAESGTTTMSLTASDSTGVANDAPVHDGDFTSDPAEGPSDGDASVVLPVTADTDSITVVPDAELLTGAGTVYPLYIDPDVSWGESERTLLSSDGDTFYNFSGGDDGEGVGYCGTYVTGGIGYYCGSGYKQRMYFEFAPNQLRGKRVLDATFRVTERWSMSCEKTVVDLVRTPNISSSTKWPGPTSNWDKLGDRTVAAGRGTACTPSQPDAPVEFNDDPDQSYENLTNTVKVFAAGGFSRLTLMLKAHDEGDPNGWKRFDDDATLDVDYVGVPAPPTSPGVLSGDVTSCETDAGDPDLLSDTKPMFSAVVQTAAGGEADASLRAHFYVQKKVDADSWDVVTEPVRPIEGYRADGATVKDESPIAFSENSLYRMAVFTRSYYSGASYVQSSSTVTTKGWCYFKVDLLSPRAPVITLGGPYSVCSANLCDPAGGPGVKGNFTFSPASVDTNSVVGYVYKLASSTSWSALIPGQTVTRQIAPDLSGTQVLEVRAKDDVDSGRLGLTARVKFNVKERPGATGRWHFDDSAPGSDGTTAADTATTEGTRHPATLYTTGAGWSSLARRGEGDRSLWLNATNDTTRHAGYAVTGSAPVNTQSSFTVSAWANLRNSSDYRTVLSQTGSDKSGFSLYYSAGIGKWVFLWSWADKDKVRQAVGAEADVEGVTLNAWTHLAGVYNAEDATIQLYVNGRPQGSPVVLPAGAETQVFDGPMQFGRAAYKPGTYQDYWQGRVDEVAVFQQALRPVDVAEEARLLNSDNTSTATELVADWNPEQASGTTLADTLSGYEGRTLTLSGGASLNGEAIVLDGTNGAATVSGPVVDDTGSFTVTTEVELDKKALDTKAIGYTAQVIGQRNADGSAWGLWYKLTGTTTTIDDDGNEQQVPVGYWYFGRLEANGDFSAVQSDAAAVVDGRAQLTGVHNAEAGKIALYLDSTQNGTDKVYAAVLGTGELAVGKGYVDSDWSHYLPGQISRIRIWAGAAANGSQVDTMTSS
ncbi:LamG domain-containing protein [Streptomyces sp. NPDC000878]